MAPATRAPAWPRHSPDKPKTAAPRSRHRRFHQATRGRVGSRKKGAATSGRRKMPPQCIRQPREEEKVSEAYSCRFNDDRRAAARSAANWACMLRISASSNPESPSVKAIKTCSPSMSIVLGSSKDSVMLRVHNVQGLNSAMQQMHGLTGYIMQTMLFFASRCAISRALRSRIGAICTANKRSGDDERETR